MAQPHRVSLWQLPARKISISLPRWALVFIVLSTSCTESPQGLFNGKDLSGWDVYLGPAYDTVRQSHDGPALGLNHDPSGVFGVANVDGEPAIRISGAHFGGISTLEEYGNYHLQLEFRWGTQRFPPRRTAKRDSGLLYHAVGPHGAGHRFWMRSQEFQIQEGDCGDYWGVAGTVFDIPAVIGSDSVGVYTPGAGFLTFKDSTAVGRHCVKNPDAEKPSGEWNVIDLYCLGDTAVHVMNGVTVMVLYHSRQSEGQGEIPLTRGKIQLQSEGAEVYYRRITLEPISAIPTSVLK